MLDFLRLCQNRNIPVDGDGAHHHSSQGWIQSHCPFCTGGADGWHLGYNITSGAFSCWRCGKLKFWEVIERLFKVNEDTARRLVSEFQMEGAGPPKPSIERRRNLEAPPGTAPMLARHKRYLRGRGFDPDRLAEDFGLLGTGCAGKWKWRVIIPITVEGRVVAYQGRSIGDAKPKYLMTDDEDCLVDPRTILYGLDKVPGDSVIVVEGVTGVWRIGPGTVATLGVNWDLHHVNQLRRFRRRFILFDPEPLAQRRALALAHALSLFNGTVELLQGFNCDPGELARRDRIRLRRLLRHERARTGLEVV